MAIAIGSVGFVGSLGVVATGAQAADPQPKVDMTPANPLPSGYFKIQAKPGTTVHEAVILSNPGSTPVTAHVAPLDADTAIGGGSAFPAIGTAPQRAGRWITPDKTEVPLAPHAKETVPFAIAVPQDAQPGVHLAGLAAWLPPVGNQGSGDSKVQVLRVTRSVIGVEVRLLGGQGPALKVDSVATEARPQGAYVVLTLRNTGSDYAVGDGTVTVDGKQLAPFKFDNVVPDTTLTVPLVWEKNPTDGAHPTRVTVHYNGEATPLVEWSGDLQVGKNVQDQLRDLGTIPATSQAASSNSSSLTKILLGVGGLVVLAIILGVILWLRRRRQRPTPVQRLAPARPPLMPARAGSTVSPPAHSIPPQAQPSGQEWNPRSAAAPAPPVPWPAPAAPAPVAPELPAVLPTQPSGEAERPSGSGKHRGKRSGQ